ncbi:MAG: hypothetical protein HOP09_17685 [Hyphomicrobium sp.]|nr:hypothetical protein [Hyphomicrobium sp.]
MLDDDQLKRANSNANTIVAILFPKILGGAFLGFKNGHGVKPETLLDMLEKTILVEAKNMAFNERLSEEEETCARSMAVATLLELFEGTRAALKNWN